MSKGTMALATVLLACCVGTASAQGQGSGQAQTMQPPGQRPVSQSTPAYRQQVPDVVPLGPHIDKPKVNPSAAGTLTEWERRSNDPTDPANREHSGSIGTNANTHPLRALEAGGELRQEGMTQPPGVYPTPRSTMNRDAGR
jgi:hypothetical protein